MPPLVTNTERTAEAPTNLSFFNLLSRLILSNLILFAIFPLPSSVKLSPSSNPAPSVPCALGSSEIDGLAIRTPVGGCIPPLASLTASMQLAQLSTLLHGRWKLASWGKVPRWPNFVTLSYLSFSFSSNKVVLFFADTFHNICQRHALLAHPSP